MFWNNFDALFDGNYYVPARNINNINHMMGRLYQVTPQGHVMYYNWNVENEELFNKSAKLKLRSTKASSLATSIVSNYFRIQSQQQ